MRGWIRWPAVAALAAALMTSAGEPARAQEAAAARPAIVERLLELVGAQSALKKTEVDRYGTLLELSKTKDAELPSGCGRIATDGTATIGAFHVRVLLPNPAGGFDTKSVEADQDWADLRAALAQQNWCAYAWPASDKTLPTYFVSDYGRVLSTSAGAYVGKSPDGRAAWVPGDRAWLIGVIAVDAKGTDRKPWSAVASVARTEADQKARATESIAALEARNRVLEQIETRRKELIQGGTPAERGVAKWLQGLTSGQSQFQALAAVDLDNDGVGEFGTLPELRGERPMRMKEDGSNEGGRTNRRPFPPPGAGDRYDGGDLIRGGYRIRLLLPAQGNKTVRDAGGSRFDGGSVNSDFAESTWCAYAWPESGEGRAYFVNQVGDVLFAEKHAYRGAATPPAPEAAFSDVGLGGILGIIASDDRPGQDGNRWTLPGGDLEPLRADVPSDAERSEAFRLIRESKGTKPDDPDPVPTSRKAANEISAIATLRNLTSAQAQFQATARADVDNDGVGEFGVFQELSGALEVRTQADGSNSGGRLLSPAILSGAFKLVREGGTVKRSGYCFRIWLPDADGKGVCEDKGKILGAGKIHTDYAETTWCIYAWPQKLGTTGDRAFCANQSGDIIGAKGHTYDGKDAGPKAGAAFESGGEDVIIGTLAIGRKGQDGNEWRPVN